MLVVTLSKRFSPGPSRFVTGGVFLWAGVRMRMESEKMVAYRKRAGKKTGRIAQNIAQ